MHKQTLTEGDGYVVIEDIIPHRLLDLVNSKLTQLHPIRASSRKKQYAEGDSIANLPDIAVWWSQLIMDWTEVIEMNEIIFQVANECIDNAKWYASDAVFTEPHSEWVNPHVDTPHRFEKWNEDKRLLGLQCIVPLYDLGPENGVTGLVPGSQARDFYIDMCYSGYYNSFYKRRNIQPVLKKGSVLIYNCRVLHSSMPNPTDTRRPALLFNYLNGDIIDELKSVDNIWKSNK